MTANENPRDRAGSGLRSRRIDWPLLFAGFAIGLMIAAALAGLWLMLFSGSDETFELRESARTAAADRGLIGSTYANIAQRLDRERGVVRPVRGDLSFRVSNIVWTDPRHPDFVRAAEMRGRIDTRAAAHGDVVVRGVAIRDAAVLVEQNERLEWNYRRALNRLLGDRDDSGPDRSFIVMDAAITNADVRVVRPDMAFTIDDVAAQLPRAQFAGPGLRAPRVTIARATGTLLANDSAYAVAANDAQLEFPAGGMNFRIASITTGESELANLQGVWGGSLPGLAIVATGSATRLRFEDIAFLGPRVPAEGSATFDFRVRPLGEQSTEVELSRAHVESGRSNISGAATIRFGSAGVSLEAVDARLEPLDLALIEQIVGDTLPYGGTVSGTARGTNGIVTFDVTSRLANRSGIEPFVTHLIGTVRASSNGFEVHSLEADLRDAPLRALASILPVPLKGTINGRITLNGKPGEAPIDVRGRVQIAGGVAIVDGRVNLSARVPTYNLTVRVIAVNLQQLLEPEAPPVFMTARLRVDGSGRTAATLDARLALDGRFTGWRTGPQDRIHVVARVRDGTLAIDSATAILASMRGSARGHWRFVEPADGNIAYALSFDPITPFGEYIPAIGDADAAGSLALDGAVSGALSGSASGARGIRIAGAATGHDLMIGDWGATSLESKYEIITGGALPQFTFDASAREFRTPTAGRYQTARANISLASPAFTLDISADRDDGGGGLEVFADGRIPPAGEREIILHRARVDLGDRNWALVAPAVFTWAGAGTDLAVRGFELRRNDGNGLLKLDGRVLPLANADFTLETVAVPVGDVQRLLGQQPHVGGALTTSTAVRAINGVPELMTRFQLDSAVVENIHFTQLTGDAEYRDQHLVANATARVDTSGSMVLRADVPLELRFGTAAGARLLDSGPVHITLISDSIALAPLAALDPSIEDLTGTLTTNISVTGTVEQPELGGTLAVRNAAVHVIPANQSYDSINATVHLENRRAVIDDLVARAGGRMRMTGSVAFEELDKPSLDLVAHLDDFELVGVDNQTDAGASGDVSIRGPLRGAVVSGELLLENGYFPVPQSGSRALDAELAQFEADRPATDDEDAQPPIYDALVIDDLHLVAGENLWFTMEDARAELAGGITINKRGEDLRITGELEGTRGTYTLRAGPIIRRFDVTHAYIRFLGEAELDPAIDITASRRVAYGVDRQMDIEVRIGGTLRAPTLALASETAAPIPQSELLSFLFFGQPSFVVGSGSMISTQNVAEPLASSFSELLSLQLEQAVVQEIGTSLDIFQIRLGGGRLDQFSPSLVVGEEIGHNLFLTVESGVTALFGAAETPVTSFAVHLEWRIANETTLRASYEPVNPLGILRGYTVALPVLRPRNYQTTLELRRRWSW